MIQGGMNHLALTVSDMRRSTEFYEKLLNFMGMQRVEDTPELILWFGPGGGVTISPAKPESAHKAHDRYAPGLHHFAFHADSRESVDGLYALMQEVGAEILDAPAAYEYAPGYYAVYFLDPDGIKLEYAYMDPIPG